MRRYRAKEHTYSACLFPRTLQIIMPFQLACEYYSDITYLSMHSRSRGCIPGYRIRSYNKTLGPGRLQISDNTLRL